jgi:hypothetical protein
VFTAIADVKDTLTECCDEIKSDIFDTQTLIISDFAQTWTILAGLDLNCSTTVIIDLNGVFTVLANLDVSCTAEVDLNGVFTAIADVKDTLTECCDEIKSDIFDTQTLIISDFAQTWTILAGLDLVCSTTVVIDLNGVFTVLANLDVSCTAEVDLGGVFTAIADVKDTLTECCDEITSDIFDTNTLMIDLFEQTWTILAGQVFNITVTVQTDLNGIFTAIADVKDTLTECCDEIKSDIFDTQTLIISDFAQTWTILANLNINATATVDLSGVYTAIADVKDTLTECCDEIKSDIFDTQTLIISDFAQTWTILANLNINATATVDLSGVFTAIADVKDTLT